VSWMGGMGPTRGCTNFGRSGLGETEENYRIANQKVLENFRSRNGDISYLVVGWWAEK
jgi:hypothetical protein